MAESWFQPDAWRAGGDFLTWKSHQIFVRACGPSDAPPILCLHGFPSSSHDYGKLVSLLPSFRLLCFDFLGFGFSDKPKAHCYSLMEQAEIAEAVAAHFGVKEATILAHDMGDSVALEILRRDVLRVSRLILMNGSVLLQHYKPLITQRLLLHRVTGPLISKLGLINRRVFGKQFGAVFAERPSEAVLDEFWSLILEQDGIKIYHLLIQYLRERMQHELMWLDVLEAHHAPLTVIWGLRDPVSRPEIAQAVLARRPDADYHPIPEVGHYPQWEAPALVSAWIEEAMEGEAAEPKP